MPWLSIRNWNVTRDSLKIFNFLWCPQSGMLLTVQFRKIGVEPVCVGVEYLVRSTCDYSPTVWLLLQLHLVKEEMYPYIWFLNCLKDPAVVAELSPVKVQEIGNRNTALAILGWVFSPNKLGNPRLKKKVIILGDNVSYFY